jgi:hypothetical protein
MDFKNKKLAVINFPISWKYFWNGNPSAFDEIGKIRVFEGIWWN